MRILWLLLLLLCINPSTSAEASDKALDEVPILIDLHAHTTLSDGTDTPLALVQRAVAAGVSVLAFTDHDQLSYDAEAIQWARTHGLEIIQGTEISCEWTFHFPRMATKPKSGKVHLLGYFTQASPPASELGNLLTDLQAKRTKRNTLILQKLKELFDIELSEQDVIDAAQAVERMDASSSAAGVQTAAASATTTDIEYLGRPHIALALVAGGWATDIADAFARFLSDEVLPLPAWSLEFGEALRALAAQGAVPILAHPTTIGLDMRELEQELDWFVHHHQGHLLKGLEVYSSKHSASESAALRAMAERMGLFITGGSDFHGTNKAGVPLARFGRGEDGSDSTAKWAGVNRGTLRRMKQLQGAAMVRASKKASETMSMTPEEWDMWARSDSHYLSNNPPPATPAETIGYFLVMIAALAMCILCCRRRWTPKHTSIRTAVPTSLSAAAAIDSSTTSVARHSVNHSPSSSEGSDESSSDDGNSLALTVDESRTAVPHH